MVQQYTSNQSLGVKEELRFAVGFEIAMQKIDSNIS